MQWHSFFMMRQVTLRTIPLLFWQTDHRHHQGQSFQFYKQRKQTDGIGVFHNDNASAH